MTGLRRSIVIVSGRQLTWGTAPFCVSASVKRRLFWHASGLSSRSSNASQVTGRPLSVKSNSSNAYSLSLTTDWSFVSASSIHPLPNSFRALLYAVNSSQVIPLASTSNGIASTVTRSHVAISCPWGLQGAIPTPQLHITTLVTPCQDEDVIKGSQLICAS